MEDQAAREELLQDAVAAVDVAGTILQVCRRDTRFRFGAYQWLLGEGLAYIMHVHLRLTEQTRRHMSGREIAEGLRALAREQFGALARDVWQYWGIRSTRHWGEVVYNLIDAGLLQKNDEDNINDFNDIYDFGTL